MFNTKLTQSIAETVSKIMNEKLHPNQQKIDVHEPEKDKLTAKDFEMLRKGKKAVKEESEQIQEYTSVGGKYVHRQKEVKDTEAGVTDWDKEEKMAKDVAKPAAKKRAYGAHQNRRTNTKLYKEMIESLKTGGIKSFFKTIEEGKIEQIEELKKSTLGSYVKKASSDLHNQSFDHGEDEHRQYGAPEDDPEAEADMQKRERDIENRKKGITRAVNKLTKEEASQEEFTKEMEDQKAKFDGKKKGADFSKPPVYTVRNEEVEQLDELSPTALKSYVNKAKPEVKAAKAERADARDAGDGKTANDAFQMAKKRTAGIKLAKMKLNKEEATIDEATHTEIQVYDMTDGSQKPQVNIVDLEEKSLTDAETAKKEEIVKSMKKGLQGFKDRYGDRAKQVMYATATKTAKEKA
jgi:hypothetical protein